MFKRRIAFFLILSTVVLGSMAACGKVSENVIGTEGLLPLSASSEEDDGTKITESPIPFQYLYRGFSPISLENREEMEAFSQVGTKIITSEENWSAYMGKYCPGIPYNVGFDFSRDCLIASVRQGARPTYIGSNTIRKIDLKDGALFMEYDNAPDASVYVLNNDATAHFYVEIVVVSRDDVLPEAESYVYKP